VVNGAGDVDKESRQFRCEIEIDSCSSPRCRKRNPSSVAGATITWLVLHELTEDADIVKLFVHWDESYWEAVYIVLPIEGALFAGFFQAGKGTGLESLIRMIIGLLGVLMSFLWMLLLSRKRTFVEGVERLLMSRHKELYAFAKEKQKGTAKYSSLKIVNFWLTNLFVIIWTAILCALF